MAEQDTLCGVGGRGSGVGEDSGGGRGDEREGICMEERIKEDK